MLKSNFVALRRQTASDQQTSSGWRLTGIRTMTIVLRRAQRLGGASLLLLGAAATSALAEDKSSTELPSVTVTAPSPIVRRAVVPPRNPVRATRTARARSHEPT